MAEVVDGTDHGGAQRDTGLVEVAGSAEEGALSAHLRKRRRSFTVDVRLEVAAGEAVALFGSSGAGKSTVLGCLAGFEQPDEGFVRLGEAEWFRSADDGRPAIAWPLHRRSVGLLTQQPGLFPHLSVKENVLFGLTREQRREPETAAWIRLLTERLGLAPLWEARPGAISGGQARRVALARTLARRPHLLLLDEPFAGLDRPLVRELLANLRDWRTELGFSLIAVDHQPEVLRALCPERVMAIEAGRVVQAGRWEALYGAPATELLRAQLTAL